MNYRAIGFGEGDFECCRDHERQDCAVLDKSEPPVAQSVYVCGWCFGIVEPSALNWTDSSVYVCDCCAEDYFTK